MSQSQVAGTYRPFKYPPDYALARIHQKATMPGKADPLQLTCPCCDEPIKRPFSSWWNRSIQKDFKEYGGGIVSYFWLAKLYCLTIVLVIALYGVYVQYLSWNYCEELQDAKLKGQVCSSLFGVWIITNEDLYDLLERAGDNDVIVRFSILRSLAFLILIAANASSLYIMKWFKTRYPDKPNVANFSLFFRNLFSQNVEDLLVKLRAQFGHFQVRQAFILKQAQPFYKHYKQKLQLYYECRRQENQTKLSKLKSKLSKADEQSQKFQQQFEKLSRRGIIVFNDSDIRNKILKKYTMNRFRKNLIFFKGRYGIPDEIFCQQCPRNDEILWQNIGIQQKLSYRVKLITNLMYLGILCFALLLLYLLSRILYFDKLKGPARTAVQNFILLVVIVISLMFRRTVDMLADMRFLITFTARTMYIVITTVMLHFVFYLWLPSLYLNLYHDVRGSVLNLMSNQAFTLVVVQIILTYVDLFYCCWNKNKKKVQDEDRPYACQQILHENMQYPRFPFQFKSIVLFKFWSLITFFGFHIPMVLFLILIALTFHFIKDKFNIYFHYRTEIIDNKVQFSFLKLYTNLFTIFMYVIFVHTQKKVLQYVVGATITAIALFFQLYYFNRSKSFDPHEEEGRIQLLSHIDNSSTSFYREKHDSFFEKLRSEIVDNEIKNYLGKQPNESKESISHWSINGRN